MRVKTEDRRQAIVDVAIEVFREVGFERASMAVIARRLGGSKGTLYGYFQSKAELFETAMKAASEGPGDEIMELLDPSSDNIRAVLKRFALAYLAFTTGADILAIRRTAIAEGFDSPLGPHLFDQGPGRAVKRGRIRKAPPKVISRHFKALIEAGFLEEALHGAKGAGASAVDEAIDTFLRAFAP